MLRTATCMSSYTACRGRQGMQAHGLRTSLHEEDAQDTGIPSLPVTQKLSKLWIPVSSHFAKISYGAHSLPRKKICSPFRSRFVLMINADTCPTTQQTRGAQFPAHPLPRLQALVRGRSSHGSDPGPPAEPSAPRRGKGGHHGSRRHWQEP